MVQDAVPAQSLRRAGDLAPLHQNIVSAGGLRLQTQTLQRLDNRVGEARHADALLIPGIGDEGVIQVAQIVVDGAAAGAAAHYVDVMLLHKGTVDLRLGVLVLPHHDGVVILPQQ